MGGLIGWFLENQSQRKGVLIQMLIIVSSSLLGALIGWITNKIAIKMLFKPVHPIKIAFFTIQGVFPKRQAEIAKSLGKIVNEELVGLDDFKTILTSEENIRTIKEKIKLKLETTIKENIPSMFLMMAGDHINAIIEKFMNEDQDDFIKDLIQNFLISDESMNISKIVEDKVNQMDFGKFERVLLELINNELKHIEYLGAILGLVIGLSQGILLTLLN